MPRSWVGGALFGVVLLAGAGFVAGWWVGRVGGTVASVASTGAPMAPTGAPTAPIAAPTAPTVAPVAQAVADPLVAVNAPASAAPRAPDPLLPTPSSSAEAARARLRPTPPTRGFGVQLGAFERESEALAFVEAHARELADLPVFVVPTVIEDRGTWYRVRLADVKTRAAAEAVRLRLAPALAERAIVVSHK